LGVLIAIELLSSSGESVNGVVRQATLQLNQWLGRALGWTDHVVDHSHVGAWAIFALVSALGGLLLLPVGIALIRRWGDRSAVLWLPGLACVVVPWFLWSVTSEVHLSGARPAVLYRTALVVVSLVVTGVLGSWFAHRIPLRLGVWPLGMSVVSLGGCAWLAYWVRDPYAWPLTVAVALWSALLLSIWTWLLNSTRSGRDNPR
jgi:uncharacterized membrane protein YvlD (DUF360 family)